MNERFTSERIRAALKGYEPTGEQWNAIASGGGPSYLIAGAGSGKTAVMAARIVWLIENKHYAPTQILGLTFTNKAAEELQERVHSALQVGGEHRVDDITVQTYNAFAAGIVRDHGLLVDVEPYAGLLTDAQQWQLVLNCIDELPPFEAIELRTPGSIVRATLALASSLSDHIVTTASVRAADERTLSSQDATRDMRETAAKRQELCAAVDAYVNAKRKHERIDFGDQVLKAVEVLEDYPHIQESYVERYPIVLLDEYQDTNVAQRRMLQALTRGGDSVTAVGDARQAIFAWRGATMYNLIGFPDHFPRADRERYAAISLSENFRSGERILEVANEVAAGIDERRRPGLPLRAHPANGAGAVALGLFTDEGAEAEFLATECERLHGKRAAEGRPDVEWKDIAVLVRRRATMEPIQEAFKAHDIPVEVVGLSGLLNTPEVVEIVAWLRSLESKPVANRWLARLLLGPRWRIHYRDLSLCARWASEQNWDLRVRLAAGDHERARDLAPGDVGFSLSEALDHVEEIERLGAEARARLRSFNRRLGELRHKTHLPLLELVDEVIQASGVRDTLESSPSRSAPAALQNVANFVDHVAAFAPIEGEATLRSFLSYLDAAEVAEETLESAQPAEQNSVKLMTVHSAKGLEFECVFLPSVAASKNRKGAYVYSVFPNTRSSNPLRSHDALPYEVREDHEHLPVWKGKASDFESQVKERTLEDERRLFYVALTRAKQRLYVTTAWWYGRGDLPKGPSEFFDELRSMSEKQSIEVLHDAEMPPDNPVVDALEGRRAWPPAARAGEDDVLFAEGWGRAADRALADPTWADGLIDALADDERDEARRLIGERESELDLIARAATETKPVRAELPDIVSATAHIALGSGRLEPWDLMRPLPDRPTSARRLGTEVHRLIEERSRGISPYPEESELDEPGEVTGPGVMTSLLDHWEGSGYAERELATLPSGEPMIELPFTLRLGDGRIVRGRIDAVYTTTDGGLEIVDFKSGKRFEPGELDQLDIYARALNANGLIPEGAHVTLTYLFLDGNEPIKRTWTP
ncbi:MAG: UvrD-helicase domain-containing protein [Actinomycetota bacterium]